jgi:hypothetical protein
MEKNRSIIFRVVFSVLAVGAVAAVLFGLTGVLRDPSVETAVQAEQAKTAVAQRSTESTPKSDPPQSMSQPSMSTDGGMGEQASKGGEPEPSMQFDDEPSGS